MTCVAYVETEEGAWLGTDSLGVSGRLKSSRKDKVVMQRYAHGDTFLFAGAGSFRFHDLLRYSLDIPKITTDLREYMVTEFIPALRHCLKEHGVLEKKDSADHSPSNLYVVTRGYVFHVGGDFQVGLDMDSYGAIGSGQQFALGSLATTENAKISPELKVKAALMAAARHCTSVGGTFDIRFQPKKVSK